MDILTYDGDKLHFPKVYIEVNLTGDLPSEVEVILEDGSSHFVKVDYLGKPVLCTICQRVGHKESSCRQKERSKSTRERSKSVCTKGRSKQRKVRNQSSKGNTRQVWKRKPPTPLDHIRVQPLAPVVITVTEQTRDSLVQKMKHKP